MSFDPKYTVFKTVLENELEAHTQDSWDLLQAFQVTSLVYVTEDVPNPHPPPPTHTWGSTGYGSWNQLISTNRRMPMKVLKFLLGKTELKATSEIATLRQEKDNLEVDKKTFQTKLEHATQEWEKDRKQIGTLNDQISYLKHDMSVKDKTLEQHAKANKMLHDKNFHMEMEINDLHNKLVLMEKLLPESPATPTRVVEP